METYIPPKENPFSSIQSESVHFVGVLGIGISSLARWFIAQKWAVSGSDAALSPIYPELKKDGLKAKIGHKKDNIPSKCGLVIYSQAVKPNNPELREAMRRNIPVISYPEAIGELTKFYKTICVSGMHGKSTTTAITALTLVKAGFDPTVIIGTKLKEFGNKNFRVGNGEYLILEADEYKDAFLNYSPLFAITTNIDREHLDYFKNAERIKKSFLEFYSGIRNGGALVLNRDSEMLHSLKQKIDKVGKINNVKIKWYSLRDKEAAEIKKYIKLPGRHNVSNALAVFCLSKFIGIDEKFFSKTISEYGGAWRRMEYRGVYQAPDTRHQTPVYDDYAHHPTEIKATLQAFKEKFPGQRIICVFQPHQAERLKILFNEFKDAFDDADTVIIASIYKVVGRESSVASGQDSESLVRAMQKSRPGRKIFYIKDLKNIKNALNVLLSDRSFPCPLLARTNTDNTRKDAENFPRRSALSQRNSAGYAVAKSKSAIVIMMGAGDIVNYTDTLIE